MRQSVGVRRIERVGGGLGRGLCSGSKVLILELEV
jgi:hypothetical protein